MRPLIEMQNGDEPLLTRNFGLAESFFPMYQKYDTALSEQNCFFGELVYWTTFSVMQVTLMPFWYSNVSRGKISLEIALNFTASELNCPHFQLDAFETITVLSSID